MIKKFYLSLTALAWFAIHPAISQVFWSENFNNGCTTNCVASSYTGPNGAWSVTAVGANGSVANEFFISCAENGEPVGSCGAGCGNNATLHVGNVPCTLCLLCPTGDCGAAYNSGPTFSGENPLTDKRAESPLISTIGQANITLSFKYIEAGQGSTDNASVEFSVDSGLSWSLLANTPKTATTCSAGQGLWTAYSYVLPIWCENITSLKIGFRWKNNSDGVGSDPSFAVDSMELSSSLNLPPVAQFNTPLKNICDSSCIVFNDLSQNSPSTWDWLFPGAVPSAYSGQSPVNICYNVPGNYDVTLIVSNTAGTDTITKAGYITVNSCELPVVAFAASDTFFCEKNCIYFTDLTINNPTAWQWYFTGATPDTSTLQNPAGICYNAYGTYAVKLVASNINGSDSAEYLSYITVNQSPAIPIVSLSGSLLTSTAANSYQWYYNSVIIPGATSQSYTAQATGDYYVIITDANGCQSASAAVFVGFQGITDVKSNDMITIYPNPVTASLFIYLYEPLAETSHVILTDITGRKIFEKDLETQQHQHTYQIDLSFAESGTYLIHYINSHQSVIKKLFKH
jgi:PKD repeat protein